MKCIIGLGNPGSEYEASRHNIGFRVVTAIADARKLRVRAGDGEFYCARMTEGGSDVLLVLPTTFMNNSGVAVHELCSLYGMTADDILVVYDDFQLPFGTLRMRANGSDGGHNGLGSIIYHLGTDVISRLRVGIAGATIPAAHTHTSMAAYVLTGFEADEEKRMPTLLSAAMDASLSWVRNGTTATMNVFNKNFFSDSVES